MTDADGNPVESGPDIVIVEEFDPESPYAFSPPEYDTLPKDPPKYVDICRDGQDNAGFQEQETSLSENPTSAARENDSTDADGASISRNSDADSGISSRPDSVAVVHGENSSQQDTEARRDTAENSTADGAASNDAQKDTEQGAERESNTQSPDTENYITVVASDDESPGSSTSQSTATKSTTHQVTTTLERNSSELSEVNI